MSVVVIDPLLCDRMGNLNSAGCVGHVSKLQWLVGEIKGAMPQWSISGVTGCLFPSYWPLSP